MRIYTSGKTALIGDLYKQDALEVLLIQNTLAASEKT
jgi:hypothetical protein